MPTRRLQSLLMVVLVVGVLPLVAVACGSDSDSSSSAPKTSSSGTQVAGGDQATTSTATETAAVSGVPSLSELTGQGYETQPPSTGPKPAKGKSVWWVSCGLAIPACSVPAESAAEAAKLLGIDFHIADGKVNAGGGYGAAVRTALATNPDAMIVHGIDCKTIKQPLRDVQAAKIPVMNVESLDCADSDPGESRLFKDSMKYSTKIPTVVDYFKAWGTISADYLINASSGKANLLLVKGPEPLFATINDGFTSELKKCPQCKIVDSIDILGSETVPGGAFEQKLRTMVLQNPTADAVFIPHSPTPQVAEIVNSGLPKGIFFGGNGDIPSMDLIRRGKLAAAPATHDSVWMGWGAMDNINRVLNGQPTVPEGVGHRVVTKSANLPETAGSPYVSPIDFKSAYRKLWG